MVVKYRYSDASITYYVTATLAGESLRKRLRRQTVFMPYVTSAYEIKYRLYLVISCTGWPRSAHALEAYFQRNLNHGMAPRHAMIALVIRYAPTCYKRWAVAHTYVHRCRTPARILHAPGHAQTMRLCRFSVWWPLRQRQGGDAEAGWPIPAGPESAQPPATIPQACLLADRGVHFLSRTTRGRGAELGPHMCAHMPNGCIWNCKHIMFAVSA